MMDKASLRSLVLEILRKTPQTHLHAIETEIRKRTDDYERHDVLTLQEILWDLLVQGVLAPGKNSLNLNLPFVHVTEFGANCLEDGAVLAHDPDGYVARLEGDCGGNADPHLIETTREALLAFLSGRYPSSIVVLGRAVEILLARLADALIRHAKRSGRGVQRLQAARSDPRRLASAVVRTLASRRLPSPLADEVEANLRGLQTLIDGSRSTDGRVRLPSADRETVLAYLLLFPAQCRFVYDLIAHLEGESPE
jgi:hypothetical protein